MTEDRVDGIAQTVASELGRLQIEQLETEWITMSIHGQLTCKKQFWSGWKQIIEHLKTVRPLHLKQGSHKEVHNYQKILPPPQTTMQIKGLSSEDFSLRENKHSECLGFNQVLYY